MDPTITFTPEKLKQLKEEYKTAELAGKDSFMFNGEHELIVGYAKYLIQYLETQFK